MRISYIVIMAALLLVSSKAAAQYKVYQDYIDLHKHLAVAEMHRSGVPASIKLAQALLESNAGRSELARRANNHFGIKCGGDWTGKTFHKEDDDYDHRGDLIKSCFREFRDVEDSYIAHSEFLRDPRKINRYGFLFHLSTTDYKEWAHGLRKAGYATDPNYAPRLIKIIEEYQLYKLDLQVTPMDQPFVADAGTKPRKGGSKKGGKSGKETILPTHIVANNEVKMVFAQAGDTPLRIATRTGFAVGRLLRYNEEITAEQQALKKGERVYLSRKKTAFRGRQQWHYVKEGETMYSIAQLYGLRLGSLLWKNRMKTGDQPAIGERLRLKWRNPQRPQLKKDIENILPEKPTIKGPDTEIAPEPFDSLDLAATSGREYHEVGEGDTLYNLSRRYSISIDQLKKINQLESDTIRKGQVIRVR